MPRRAEGRSREGTPRGFAGCLLLAALAAAPARAEPAQGPGPAETRLDVHAFRVLESGSGPVSYYRVVEDLAGPFLRADYQPPLRTMTLAIEVPERLRQATRRLRWKWRVVAFPKGGDECRPGYGDSAAGVYVTWKRGLRYYSLKYVWSSVGPQGATCDRKRNLFRVRDTVIRESGGPAGAWIAEEIDPAAEFRAHFASGDPGAEVPDLVGIGVMSDGDQTASASGADYGGFALLR